MIQEIWIEKTLLDSVNQTTNGAWIDARSIKRGSVHLVAPSTGVVQLRASCRPIKPADADAEDQIGADVSNAAQEIIQFEEPIRWLKVCVSSYSAGSAYAFLNAIHVQRTV